MMMVIIDVDDDNDNNHVYQPVEADVYDQPCKNPKACDEVDLPGNKYADGGDGGFE